MNRRGIVGIAAGLVLVKTFVLLIGALQALVGAIVFMGAMERKQIKENGWKSVLPGIAVFSVLSIIHIYIVHLIIGPTKDHHIPMLISSLVFFAILSAVNYKKVNSEPKNSFLKIAISTLLYMAVSQIAVVIAS